MGFNSGFKGLKTTLISCPISLQTHVSVIFPF